MRVRSLLVACALGSVTGLFALTLPVVATVPTAPAPPEPTLERVSLTDRGETVHEGWRGHSDGKANLVSVSWQGDPDARFTVERKVDDGGWRAAGELEHTEPGVDPDTLEGRRAAAATTGNISEPLWVGQADEVRIRLADGSARDVSLQRIESPKAEAPSGVAGASVQPVPRVISRAEWGADENLRLANCPEGAAIDDNVQLSIIHHTAGSNNYGPGASASIIRGLYAYATQTLKYCDTHYNFFIDRYGQIFEGRFGGIDKPVHAAHTLGANTNTVGVAFLGDFSSSPAPPAAIESLKALLAWKHAWHGVDPSRNVWYRTISGTDRWPAGSVHFLNSIIGHRDPGSTSCPGQIYNQLPGVRAEVFRRIVQGPVDSTLGWTPQTGKPKLMVASAFGAIYPAGSQPPYIGPAAFPGRPIVKDVELVPGGIGGYVLDGYGGIHKFGNGPPAFGPSFPVDIARDLVLRRQGGGWVLDGYGGVHPFGGAPPVCCGGYWPGQDIARKLTKLTTGWYKLDAFGAVHPIGGAPALPPGPWWPGWDIARDFDAARGGPGGYVLDGFGGVWPVGGAPKFGATPFYGEDMARGLILRGSGGYSLKASGILTPFGGAPSVQQARRTYIGADAITSPWAARGVALAP